MHTGRCCCKIDACWTVATQTSCRSFVTQSCMSAGVVLLYLSYLLVWCLTISRACWCDASLKAKLSRVVPHYQPCQLVRCLIISHAFWSHYQPCMLVFCLTIGHVFSCGASLSGLPVGMVPHFRPCLLAWYLTIGHACWTIATATNIY